jgi:hypothetical protein
VSDMSMKDILSEIAGQLDGVLLLTVMDTDCMALASWESPDNKVSPEVLGEFIQQIKSVISTFKQSANGVSKLDDVVLGTPLGYMMLMPICNGTCFIVVNTPRTVSLGSIRTACHNYAPRLEQAIPGYEPISLEESTSLSEYEIQPASSS